MSKVVYIGKSEDGIPFLIRYPEKKDLPELLRYINEISSEQTFVSCQGEQLTLNQESEWLDKQLEGIKNHNVIHLVVEINGKISGVSGVNMSTVTIGKHVGVFGISIAKDFRTQGIGKILIEKVVAEAKTNLPQLKILVLGVFSNNPIAKKLYEEFGFKEYGRLPKGVLHREEYVDDIKMYKEV